MIPVENSASLTPALRDSRVVSFARDALYFIGLATVVALGAAVILSALVLLLAEPVDATPAADSTPTVQPQPAAPRKVQCTPRRYLAASFEIEGASESCHNLMRIPNAPDANRAPGLLRVRVPDAADWRSA